MKRSYWIVRLLSLFITLSLMVSFGCYGDEEKPSNTGVDEDLERVERDPNIPPLAPNMMSVNLGADGKSIVINGLYVDCERRYKVNWRSTDDCETCWNSTIVGSVSDTESTPRSYTITTKDGSSLSYWNRYVVKACAITETDVEGAYSTPVLIETVRNIQYTVTPLSEGGKYKIESTAYPEGSVSWKVSGTVFYYSYEGVPDSEGDVAYRYMLKSSPINTSSVSVSEKLVLHQYPGISPWVSCTVTYYNSAGDEFTTSTMSF